MNLDFLGEGLLRNLAGRFGELFIDRGLSSLTELESAAEFDPQVAVHHLNLGRRMLQDAKPQIALQAFIRAVRLDPNNPFARIGLACALEAMNKTQTAVDELQYCLEVQPGYQPAAFALEYCTRKLGDADITSETQYHAEEVLSAG